MEIVTTASEERLNELIRVIPTIKGHVPLSETAITITRMLLPAMTAKPMNVSLYATPEGGFCFKWTDGTEARRGLIIWPDGRQTHWTRPLRH